MDHSTIRDNHAHGTVGDFLKHNITPDADLAIVSAYFTIYAYHQLKANLDAIRHLRFLFGEPTFIQGLNPDQVSPREYTIVDDALSVPPDKRLSQSAVARECAAWLAAKAEIRSMVKPNFLHGKLYYIQPTHGRDVAIAGSSNFTVNGLGLGGSANIELNLITDSDRDRQDLRDWFDALWNDQTGLVEDVKAQVLRYLAQLYAENDPQFIYFKTLFHLFEEYLDEQARGGLLDERAGFYDSEIWQALYDFQKDGVRGAINKILKHNGCIIADSVGLGKTFEALAVIKYFELLNARVLVLCPKKLSGNWTIYQASQNHALNPFKRDRFGYTVLFHTDMGRVAGRSAANAIDLEHFNWGAYDLVVIDESHNFRGNPTESVAADGQTRLNRAGWLMEKILKAGVRTKVLMLSATPVNNTLRDLRNQIALITEGQDDALAETCKIKSVAQTLETAQRQFTLWANPSKTGTPRTETPRTETPRTEARSVKQLLERLDSSFFTLLDELTIARSRKHVVNFYDVAAIGSFPTRNKPRSVYPAMDVKNRFPSYDAINQQILDYKLSIFNPSAYVRPERAAKYAARAGAQGLHFTQADREHFLIGMMKVNFLKRLESSIESFEITLDRIIGKIERLEEKIAQFARHATGGEATLADYTPDEAELEESADADEWQVGEKLRFDLADLDLERWLADLRRDKDALSTLWNNAQAVTPERDAKLAELKALLRHKVAQPLNGDNRKVLVFTAFADTAQYLYAQLRDWARAELGLHCALVCGSVTQTTLGKNDYDSILVNFAPRAKNRAALTNVALTDAAPAAEIDLLIATDCISEGQNLQDCDYLVNYDIHWNPVRIIQRFGRIDRLGSRNAVIQLVNFWPTQDLDRYINLKTRVEARMALVDVTATGDDNLLNAEQLTDLITDDLNYRNQQLKRLQNEVLDLEDMDETLSLTDFTLDDFRVELLNFLEANRRRLVDAPEGLYAVVPAPGGGRAALSERATLSGRAFSTAEQKIIQPGVIFCLRHKDAGAGAAAVNPLSPYFLVYVRDDGTVRYNYTHAKSILEIYRRLCQGRATPYAELCDLFNAETADGTDMARYTGLLQKAAREIVQVFRRKSHLKLTTDRGALLLPQVNQAQDIGDFELVTWLVIK